MKTEAELENGVNWGFMLYSVCTAALFFLGVFPGKEGEMNLEVSKVILGV